MATEWEQAGLDAINQSSGMLGGAITGSSSDGQAYSPGAIGGWSMAGSQAIASDANGNTWQSTGSNAAGGWLGAGQDAMAGGSWQGAGQGAISAYATNNVAFDPTQWGAGARDSFAGSGGSSGGAGGGGGYAGGTAPIPSPSPITGGSSGSGGGGGSGGGAPTPQRPNQGGSSGAVGSSNATGGLNLSGLLGLGSQFFNQQVPATGAPDLGLNIPGISQTPGILSNQSQEGSSFGSLISGSGVQQTNQQYTPQNFNDAAQQALQSFTGQGKGESGSPFQGGMGSTGASAGSGSGFAGTPPTPFQALAQGQMTQPNTQMNAAAPLAGINPAILGMSGGGLGGSQQPGVVPGMAPITPPSALPGGAVASSGMASEGATGNAPGQAGSAGPEGASGLPGGLQKVAFVNPDMPGKPIELAPAPPPKPVDQFVNPDSPKKPTSPADAGRSAMQPPSAGGAPEAGRQALTATPKEGFPGLSVQRDIVDPAGAWAQKYLVNPYMVGKTKGFVDLGDSLVSPTGAVDQKNRTQVQQMLDKEKTAVAQDTKDHPYISAAANVLGELTPYIAGGGLLRAAGIGLKGNTLTTQILKNAGFNGLVGAGQYAPTQVDRAVNTGIGILFGAGGSLISPIVSKIGSTTALAAAGGVTGYANSPGIFNDPWTTIKNTAYGVAGGAATGKTGQYLNLGRKGLETYIKKNAAKVDDVASKADEFVPGFGQGRTQADQAAHLKSIREDFTPRGVGASFFDDAAELSAARKSMGADMPTNSGFLPKAAPAASTSIGSKVYTAADSALKGIAPVATQEATQALNRVQAPSPSGNANVPQQAPMDPTKANNAAMLARLEKNQDKPLIDAVSPEVRAQIQQNADQNVAAQYFLNKTPKEIKAMLDTEKGRTKMLKVVEMTEGKKAAEDLKARFRQLDGASSDYSTIRTPSEALNEKINQLQVKKGDSKAEIKQKVQQLQAKQEAKGQQVSEFSETTIERMARQARESRVRRMNGRGVAGGVTGQAAKKQKSAFSAQLIQLLLSYMMKQPSTKAALAAPGEEGQMANLVMNQLRVKAAGG